MMLLFLKLTVLLSFALAVMPLLGRATAAIRHLICAAALAGALLLPLTLGIAPHAIRVSVPVVFRTSAQTTTANTSAVAFWPLLWALGAAFLLLRLALGYWQIARVARAAEPLEDSVLAADVSVPLVFGLFRQTVLLPRDADNWPPNQRTAAIRHERAHVQRGDLWTSLMAQTACAVYWFHPLVWLLAQRLRVEQELACDDAVLSAGFEPANYAEALLATAQTLTSTSLIGCHMLTSQTLKARIARLLDRSLPRTTSLVALSAAAVISMATLGAIGMTYAQEPSAQQAPYKMGPGITAPRLASKVDPKYTDEARDAKISGSVRLSVVIGTDGLAHDINVVESLDSGLDLKAVEAVQQWKFVPGQKDGEPVPVRATIEVNFKLM